MESFKEFVTLLENSIDSKSGFTIKPPQRCFLKKSVFVADILGYFVSFDPYYVSSPITLFIADTPNGSLFHKAFSVFCNDNFKNRCLWVYEEDVEFINTEGFYI